MFVEASRDICGIEYELSLNNPKDGREVTGYGHLT